MTQSSDVSMAPANASKWSLSGVWRSIVRERTTYLFLVPILVLYAVFSLYPIVQTFQLSFFDAKIVKQGPYVGLKNYGDIIAAPSFLQALGNTLLFTFASTLFVGIISLTLATLVSLPWVRFKTLFKIILFLPVVTSFVAVGYIWKWMMDSSFGIINVALAGIGIEPGPVWLANRSLAIWSLILVNTWKWIGYFLIIFVANIQAIDPTYYEAASIDGASSWQQFSGITLPLLRTAIVLTVVLGIVNYLKAFALVFVMTQGGPAGTTELMATYVYKQAFGTGQLRFGFSAAASMVLFFMIMLFTMISNKVGRVDEATQ